MCIVRDERCCCFTLKRWAIIVGVFTVLETITLVIAGALYLNKGMRANDYGGPTGYTRQPHRIMFDLAFGSCYLAFGALWVVCTIVYGAAVLVERPLYLIPWLVLQPITMLLIIAVMLSNAIALYEYIYFILIPVITLFGFFYVLVVSFYTDLQRAKRQAMRRNVYNH